MAPQKKSRVARSKATKYTKRKRSADLPIDVGDSLNAAPEGEIPPCQPKKKKGRGPGVIMPVKDDPSQRPEVWRVGQHEFSCASNPRLIAATITRLALRLMPAPLRSFHGFDDTSKKNLEIEFLERYRYAEYEDINRCREVLEVIACKRYCEELGRARHNRIKKYGWDIAAWKANEPHWCVAPIHWRGLCDIFFSDAWQEVSRQNQQNRMASGTVAHYAGSASAH
ncbi:hypothetical protein FCM35_KLT22158 [Carex littledalei]|uniref:Uncharacterized protein n=1 Tax=Carex littledalei TaxID=544730 RepID=A0A833QG53_9POAL|nr:hypothetical protein FCM35_KLT22158 [Carex littledalei]